MSLAELFEQYNMPRSFIDTLLNEDEDDEGGDGDQSLKPDDQAEYAQRIARREGEAIIATHVREAQDPMDAPDMDGAGPGLPQHPLLAELPVGAEAPIDRIDAMENNAAKLELMMKLENQKRQEYSSTPTPTA